MIVILQSLIESLRLELQQYGEMLALLDQQRDVVGLQGTGDILHSISAIDTQSGAIQSSRAHRQEVQRQLAEKLRQSSDSSFAQLMPSIPEQYRPLVTALVQENNELLQRVRQRAQQNHLLLRHSSEMMQRFISNLSQAEQPELAREDDFSSMELQPASPH